MSKIIWKEYEVFLFDELSENAQHKAINDFIIAMIETTDYEEGSDNYKKAIDDAEKMHTPWFTGEYVWDYCKEEILAELKREDALYLKEGSFFEYEEV